MAGRRRDKPARIVDAMLRTVAEQGWPAVTLDSVAAESGLDRDEVYRLTPTRAAMLGLFARRIDLVVTDPANATPAEEFATLSVCDRLFDVLMRRFDALATYRDAVAALARDLPRDPATSAALLPQAHRSFGAMLRSAGLSDAGLAGRLRIVALIAVWLAVQHVWLRDDSADQAKTMAALDARLRRLTEWSPLFRHGDPTSAT